jgi:hypothetical protein
VHETEEPWPVNAPLVAYFTNQVVLPNVLEDDGMQHNDGLLSWFDWAASRFQTLSSDKGKTSCLLSPLGRDNLLIDLLSGYLLPGALNLTQSHKQLPQLLGMLSRNGRKRSSTLPYWDSSQKGRLAGDCKPMRVVIWRGDSTKFESY